MFLEKLTIDRAKKRLIKRDYSVGELVDAYLKRITRLDGKLKAFVTVSSAYARERARWADGELASLGEDAFKRYPLLGMPFSAKDLFCVKGIRTTASANLLRDFVPEYSATVINRLESAGAILLGKTNCDAWAHGSSTENSDFFTSKNPWNLAYLPGGSSGGSASAVSARLSLFSLGTETGGSIRQPASWCGITGLKPTYGAVSRYGVVAMASSLDSPGPMTVSAEDAEAVLAVIKGRDRFDATSKDFPDISPPPKSLKLGVVSEYLAVAKDSAVVSATKKALEVFQQLGFPAEEVSLLDPQYSVAVYTILQRSEVSSNLARYDGIRYGKNRSAFGAEAKKRIMLGVYTLSAGYYDAYYEKAQRVRRLIMDDFQKVFQKVDVLLAPTTPTPALKVGAGEDRAMFGELMDILVEPSTIAGLPGISIPVGFSSEGLPIGIQLIAPQGGESLLLALAKAFQKETDFHLRIPQVD